MARVIEVIEWLNNLPLGASVVVADFTYADGSRLVPVVGVVYDARNATVRIATDKEGEGDG